MTSHKHALTAASGLASIFFLASCSSLGGAPHLVDLYDMASPDGVIEVEMDRNGVIREMEATVAVETLPAAVREAAKRHMPRGRVTGAEREHTSHGHGWEVKMEVDGQAVEVVLDDAGGLIEIERAVLRGDAPEAVLRAAEDAIPDSSLKSVEIIERGDDVEYHVKRMRDGASYKVVLDESGHLIRKVREARAEIEIPLK